MLQLRTIQKSIIDIWILACTHLIHHFILSSWKKVWFLYFSPMWHPVLCLGKHKAQMGLEDQGCFIEDDLFYGRIATSLKKEWKFNPFAFLVPKPRICVVVTIIFILILMMIISILIIFIIIIIIILISIIIGINHQHICQSSSLSSSSSFIITCINHHHHVHYHHHHHPHHHHLHQSS